MNEENNSPIQINGNTNFEETISEGLTLVDFWAEWCGPCRMIKPVLEELAEEWKGKVKIAKVQLDNPEKEMEHQTIAMKYGVQGIPNLILYMNGKPVDRIVGAYPKPMFTEFLNKNYEKYQSEIQ